MKEETLRKGSGILGSIKSIEEELNKINYPDALSSPIRSITVEFRQQLEEHWIDSQIKYKADTLGNFTFDSHLKLTANSKLLLQMFAEQFVSHVRTVLESDLKLKLKELEDLKDE